jgi:hypothetical protein
MRAADPPPMHVRMVGEASNIVSYTMLVLVDSVTHFARGSRRRRRITSAVALLLVLVLLPHAAAQRTTETDPSDRLRERPHAKHFVGLGPLYLRVDADRGVSAEEIRSRVQKHLLSARIRILTDEEWRSLPAAAILHLDVTLRCERDRLSCGYHLSLALRESVRAARYPSEGITATTWRNSYTGSVSRRDLSGLQTLLNIDAGTLVLGFLDDIRASTADSRRPN